MKQAFTTLILFIAAAASAAAHHSILPFDGDHATTITGVVTRFEWANPHTHIYVDVKGTDGQVQHWMIESESPNFLTRLGWAKDSIKAGEQIRVVGGRARNGSMLMRCQVVY